MAPLVGRERTLWHLPQRDDVTDDRIIDCRWQPTDGGSARNMQIKDVAESVFLIVPMFLLVAGIVALVAWISMGAKGGKGARFAAWLGLVTLTLWCGSALAFAGLTIIYFVLGSQATIVGAVLVTVFMVAMPFLWAYVVRNRHRDDAGTPQAR
jgi:hypothetical protein